MLHDWLWLQAVGEKYINILLCVLCIENRLGRKLNSTDFHDCPVNKDCFKDMTNRLKDRLKI